MIHLEEKEIGMHERCHTLELRVVLLLQTNTKQSVNQKKSTKIKKEEA